MNTHDVSSEKKGCDEVSGVCQPISLRESVPLLARSGGSDAKEFRKIVCIFLVLALLAFIVEVWQIYRTGMLIPDSIPFFCSFICLCWAGVFRCLERLELDFAQQRAAARRSRSEE